MAFPKIKIRDKDKEISSEPVIQPTISDGIARDENLRDDIIYRTALVRWIFELALDMDRIAFLKEVQLGIKTKEQYIEFYRQLQR